MNRKMILLSLAALSICLKAGGFLYGADTADRLLQLGCLDVTKAPHAADPTGQSDSTEAIQRAVNDARDRGLVCFFPAGTYVISDTLSCEQEVSKLDRPRHVDGGTQHYWPVHRPIVLMGSAKGKRPVLKLARNAKGFDNPSRPKNAVWIWAQTWFDAPGKEEPVWGKEQANISFNHCFRGIDIDIRGHAGAMGKGSPRPYAGRSPMRPLSNDATTWRFRPGNRIRRAFPRLRVGQSPASG